MKNMKLLLTAFALLIPAMEYGMGPRRPAPTRQQQVRQPVRKVPTAAEIAQAKYRGQLATELFGPKGMGPGKPGDILNKKWNEIKDSGDTTKIQQLLELAVILTYTPLAVQILKTDPALDVSNDAKKLFTSESQATYNAAIAQAGKRTVVPATREDEVKQAKAAAQTAATKAETAAKAAEASAKVADDAVRGATGPTTAQTTANDKAQQAAVEARDAAKEAEQANQEAQAVTGVTDTDVEEANDAAQRAQDAATRAEAAQARALQASIDAKKTTPPPAGIPAALQTIIDQIQAIVDQIEGLDQSVAGVAAALVKAQNVSGVTNNPDIGTANRNLATAQEALREANAAITGGGVPTPPAGDDLETKSTAEIKTYLNGLGTDPAKTAYLNTKTVTQLETIGGKVGMTDQDIISLAGSKADLINNIIGLL